MVIQALLVAALTIGLLLFLLSLWWKQMPSLSLLPFLSKIKIKRQQQRLEAIDTLIENPQSLPKGAHLLAASFIFSAKLPNNRGEYILIKNFHEQLLLRCVLACEHGAKRFQHISTLEELIDERAKLLDEVIDTKQSVRALAKKRGEKGKGAPPEWAQQEFTKKGARLIEALNSNERKLKDILQAFIELFRNQKSS